MLNIACIFLGRNLSYRKGRIKITILKAITAGVIAISPLSNVLHVSIHSSGTPRLRVSISFRATIVSLARINKGKLATIAIFSLAQTFWQKDIARSGY